MSNVEYLTNDRESMSWSKDLPTFLKNYKVLAWCNRFLLCINKCSRPGDPYHVYNLVKMQLFPVCDHESLSHKFPLLGIVCYRKQGRWSLTKITHFKIVKIVRNYVNFRFDVLKMEIFDSATNAWNRKITKEVDGRCRFSTATANRGILYWRNKMGGKFLLAYDTNLDTCVVIELPGIIGVYDVFGASQNHVYYVTVDSACTSSMVWRYDKFEGEKT